MAGLALVALARSPLLDPTEDMQREIELITRSAENEALRRWARGDFAPKQEPIALIPAQRLLPPFSSDAERPIDLDEEERNTGFDFLLSESQRAELADDPEQALVDLTDARASTDDPRRWLLADLRCVQIAAKSGNRDALAQAIVRLVERTDGSETLNGVSVLLTAMAAASAAQIEGDEALSLAMDQLLAHGRLAIQEGRLALPALRARLRTVDEQAVLTPNPEREVFLRPLRSTSDSELSALVRDVLASDRFHWIEQGWGDMTQETRTQVRQSDAESLAGYSLVTRHDGQLLSAWIYPKDVLIREIESWLIEKTRVPSSVRLRVDPQGSTRQGAGSRLSLTRSPYLVSAILRDPAAFRENAQSGYRWLRIVMHALGVMCALLGWALHRQRQRELAVQRLKSEFVANVSHELRTPLSSILLMAENLRGEKVGEETRGRYHELILRESQRLRRLVDDVLDFSRLDRGEGPRSRIEVTDLAAYADELRADLHAWAEQHSVALDWSVDGWTGNAHLDREALRRALFNLVDNARRHARAEQLHLSLAAQGADLQLACRDFGPGLPEGTEDRVFQPFEQLDPSSTDGKGAGLGLAIVAEIARAHGGRATAANHPDGGAVFTLTLPRQAIA